MSGVRETEAASRSVRVRRVEGTRSSSVRDSVAIEAPLNLELDASLIATTMRTPGDDESLALGFAFTEGLLDSFDDVATIEVEHAERDVVRIRTLRGTPRDGAVRVGTITAACGACGRLGLEELVASVTPVTSRGVVRAASIHDAFAALRLAQPCFDQTGGVHAAGAIAADGSLLATAEDVGRHNAVDKVVGRLIAGGSLELARLLVVSGRPSFEIVHKAIRARLDAVAGVSAPSSLAIELAERAGLVLCGFVRDGTMNVYAGSDRLVGD